MSYTTWHWEEGKDEQRGYAEFSKGLVHTNDVNQDPLRYVRGPEHQKAKLGNNKGEQDSTTENKTVRSKEEAILYAIHHTILYVCLYCDILILGSNIQYQSKVWTKLLTGTVCILALASLWQPNCKRETSSIGHSHSF